MKLFRLKQNSPDRRSHNEDGYADEVYVHSNNSDDSFELMPTLAMGFENSIDKKLKNSELRITGQGYFIERIDGASDSESDSSDNEGEEGQHGKERVVAGHGDEVRKWKPYEGRDDSSSGLLAAAELRQQPADGQFVVNSEIPQPAPTTRPGRVQQQQTLQPVREAQAQQVLGAEQQPVREAQKKKNLFRKLQEAKFIRRRPKSRAGSTGLTGAHTAGAGTASVQKLHTLHKDDSDVLIDFTEQTMPDSSVFQTGFSENALAVAGSLSHTENANEAHAETSSADSTLSIPVVSQVFAFVDSQENLSPQHRLLVKVAVLLWLLYEINWVLECCKSFFAY